MYTRLYSKAEKLDLYVTESRSTHHIVEVHIRHCALVKKSVVVCHLPL